ncbi:MAG: hypothetical protein E7564_03880 [Ruminococcaceae bacterium]|nr:hypothetical protein [Oscillospiraceae bacterium]
MKQKVSLLLALILTFSIIISGCGCRHQWKEATCTEASICTVCQQVQGAALGHNKGEWETGEEATIFNSGTRVRNCTRCGMTMATERYELTCYSENGQALFSPSDFTKKYNEVAGKLSSEIKAEEYSMNGVYITSLKIGESEFIISYSKGGENYGDTEMLAKGLDQMTVVFEAQAAIDNYTSLVEAFIIYFMSFDPCLQIEEAGTMVTTLFSGIAYNSDKISTFALNGVTHALTYDDEANFVLVTFFEEIDYQPEE